MYYYFSCRYLLGKLLAFYTAGKSENLIILAYLFQCTFFKLSANVKIIFIGSSCSL